MQETQNILNKHFIKIGLLLGAAFVLAQYLFYFGGRSVVFNTNFDSAIQLLTIMGLYFGLHYCQRLFPKLKFWQLLLYGIFIIGIAVVLKTIFSILLYTFLAPELGTAYREQLIEQMTAMVTNMKSLPQEQYTEMTRAILTPFTIPFFEAIQLFISGLIFSVFISALLNMFRK